MQLQYIAEIVVMPRFSPINRYSMQFRIAGKEGDFVATIRKSPAGQWLYMYVWINGGVFNTTDVGVFVGKSAEEAVKDHHWKDEIIPNGLYEAFRFIENEMRIHRNHPANFLAA